MLSLRYNCDLETAAQTEANKCGTQGTGAFGTENFYRIGANGFSVEQAIGHSIRYWWKQVRLVPGIGVNLVTFKPKHRNSTIRYFTLMSWAKVSSIGCGVAHCSGIYNTVCRYNPAGNIDNTPVYTKGNVCTACPSGFTRCVDSLCTA
ncbi:unnamed protein product [Nippostrongylus brasiliensis]|uniref:SCP domain-containing protein n=1 Tax=Nippostrongylus brasiliensis TaxID=27835 RepID=A0A0N4XY20_NIPBR|nr:unnamed protein product [Nippostrongylus brasiliensis]